MKITTFILLSFISISTMFAQRTIKGEVLDSFENPLNDTNIIIKGTQRGTTSVDGKFQLTVKKGDTLSISHLGYLTQQLVVQNYDPVRILFEVASLDEVLIIANKDACKTYETHTISCCCGACGFSVTSVIIKNQISEINPVLYPNPSSNGYFSIKFPKPYKTITYHVITMTGQQILKKTVTMNSSNLAIDLSGYATGLYLIQIEADGEALPIMRALKG